MLCAAAHAAADRVTPTPSADYAESVAVAAVSHDGASEVSVRLARFPAKGRATLWAHVAHRDQVYSLVDEDLSLAGVEGATPTELERASFAATGTSQVRFASRDRRARLQGEVTARFDAWPTPHPEIGPGNAPVRIELAFTSDGRGGALPGGRRELFGHVNAAIVTPEETVRLELPGKWHEQVGERPRFAPRFTYLAVQNGELAILAIQRSDATTGYAATRAGMTPVIELDIDAPGQDERRFVLTLAREHGGNNAGEDRIEGVARVVRRWSVPIEGARRPGATVVVDSSRGRLSGSLNDWVPPDDPEE